MTSNNPKNRDYCIALGANLPTEAGGPESSLRAALAMLVSQGIVVKSISRFFRTPCFPKGAGPDFVNAAAILSTALSPRELLDQLHAVEASYRNTAN